MFLLCGIFALFHIVVIDLFSLYAVYAVDKKCANMYFTNLSGPRGALMPVGSSSARDQ